MVYFLLNSSLNQGSQILGASESLGGLVKTQLAGRHPQTFCFRPSGTGPENVHFQVP